VNVNAKKLPRSISAGGDSSGKGKKSEVHKILDFWFFGWGSFLGFFLIILIHVDVVIDI
jgi:hypothetical protein